MSEDKSEVKCHEYESKRVWKDGIRHTRLWRNTAILLQKIVSTDFHAEIQYLTNFPLFCRLY